MKTTNVAVTVLVFAGIGCLGLVCIALWSYLSLFEMLDYYGVPKNIAYENPELKKTIYQLYWGMTQYSILSLICFGISIYLWKRK